MSHLGISEGVRAHFGRRVRVCTCVQTRVHFGVGSPDPLVNISVLAGGGREDCTHHAPEDELWVL